MNNQLHVAVIGGGSWGTAMVKLLLDNTQSITWYMRDHKTLAHIQLYHHNPAYLSSVYLDTQKIHLTENINEATQRADILFFAIPSAFIKLALEGIKTDLSHKIIVSGVKGLIPNDHYTISQFFREVHHVPESRIVVASGPTHSEEVAMEKLSFIAVASANEQWARKIADLLTSRYFKPKPTHDVLGTEYAAVMKNIYALGSGIAKGLAYGDNYQAAYVSKAICEIQHFLNQVIPAKRNINELQYLGDLMVTAYSQFSRNRIFGVMLGQGYSVKAARFEMKMIAEGYFATKAIHNIAREHQIQLPILNTIHDILYNNDSPTIAMKLLNEEFNAH